MTYSTRKAQQFTARSSDKKSMFPRAARIFVGVEVVFGVAYFLIPPSGLRAVVYSVVSLGMVVAVVVGVRRWKPAQPMAWYQIAAGQLLFSIGDAINYYREWVLETEIPSHRSATASTWSSTRCWPPGCCCWSGAGPRDATRPA